MKILDKILNVVRRGSGEKKYVVLGRQKDRAEWMNAGEFTTFSQALSIMSELQGKKPGMEFKIVMDTEI